MVSFFMFLMSNVALNTLQESVLVCWCITVTINEVRRIRTPVTPLWALSHSLCCSDSDRSLTVCSTVLILHWAWWLSLCGLRLSVLSHVCCIPHIPLRLLRTQECGAAATPRKPSGSGSSARPAGCSSKREEKIHLWKRFDGWWSLQPVMWRECLTFGLRGDSLTALQAEGGKCADRKLTPENRREFRGNSAESEKWKYRKSDWFQTGPWRWKHLSDAWITVCKCWVGVRLYESSLQSLCGPSLVSAETD